MTEKTIRMLPNIAKILLAIIFMVVAMGAYIASINKAMAASPIQNVAITGDTITLADIFEGAPKKHANFVLAPAPAPNQILTWDAPTLNRVARAFNLSWRAKPTDTVTIKRLATVINKDDLTKAILQSLSDDIDTQDSDIEPEFVGQSTEIILPYDVSDEITVVSSSYNPSRQSFSAKIKTSDGKTHMFTGVLHKLIDVPVLSGPVRRGDIISRHNITSMKIREDYISDDMVITMDEIVDMTPRKILPANTPVKMSDLNKPVMIKRGDLVTMELQNGPISITAIAKALETGTRGDVIRVMNMDSKRTLEAQVTGLRSATIFN